MVTVKEGRLNAKVRDRIREIVINNRFKGDYEQLVTDKATFAQTVYTDAYTKPNAKGLQDLPKGWLPERGYAKYVFAGEFTYVAFSGGWRANYVGTNPFSSWFAEPAEVLKRILDKDLNATVAQYDGLHALSKQFASLKGRESDLLTQIKKTDKTVAAQLGGVNTVKQLLEQWPEVAPFLDELGFDPKSRQVPVINRTELNDLLGLTPVEDLPTEGIQP